MDTTDVSAIKDSFDRIKQLDESIQNIGEDRRAKRDSLNIAGALQPVEGAGGAFDQAAWNNLAPAEKKATAHKLAHLKETLESIGDEDGPRDPKSLMYKTHAKNREIVSFLVVALLIFFFLLWQIAITWDEATGTDINKAMEAAIAADSQIKQLTLQIEDAHGRLGKVQSHGVSSAQAGNATADPAAVITEIATEISSLERTRDSAEAAFPKTAVEAIRNYTEKPITESRVIYTVILLGALGGTAHFVGSFVKFVGNRQLMRSWLLHYLSLPFVGAALALIVYLLLRVGLLAPNGAAGDGSSLSNLNLIGIYAFAALTGLFSGPATEKLSEIFRTMFRTEHASKDALKKPGEKPPGMPAS